MDKFQFKTIQDGFFSLASSFVWMVFKMLIQTMRLALDGISDFLASLFHWTRRDCLPPITNGLLLKPASELICDIRCGKLKCETLVKAYITRIKQINPLVNALVFDRFDEALEEARNYDKRIDSALKNPQDDDVRHLPLLGIPITIKDNFAVKGMPLSAGLYSRKDFRSDFDSTVVNNLKKSGSIVIGITNVPEFLFWWDCDNCLYGRTNNPYDLSRIAGGSSGGEAAIISAAGSVIGLGSDIGGSIRIPSFLCGIFGHKPSSFVTSLNGVYPDCGHKSREKLLSIGPMCRYAIDLKIVLKACIGNDRQILDQLKLDEPVDLKKLKFYFMTEDGDVFKSQVSSDIKEAFDQVRSFFEKNCGFHCQDVDLPLMKWNFWIWSANMSNCGGPTLAEMITDGAGKLNCYLELFKGFLGRSKFRKITCLNAIAENLLADPEKREKPQFRQLINYGIELREQIENLLGDDSVLIMPCLPDKAPKHSATFFRCINIGYTAILNWLEMPVTQCSLGIGDRSKMPVGFQITSKRMNDRLTLAVAELLDREFGGWRPPCKVDLSDENF